MQGSLLDHLGEPTVVGDPDGYVVYVNPAFREAFGEGRSSNLGVPFVELFEGGGREGMLKAIASVCESGEKTTFRLMEGGRGYRGIASPIRAEEADVAVGVILTFTEEPSASRALLDRLREMRDPLDEVGDALQELFDAGVGAASDDPQRAIVERALAALDLARKWGDDAYALLTDTASGAKEQRLDAARICRVVAGRLHGEFERKSVELEVTLPAELPEACGDPRHFETILARLLRDRAATAQPLDSVGLSARATDSGAVLVSIVESPRPIDAASEPRFERDAIAALAGYEHRRLRSAAGSATTLRLPLADGPEPNE